VAAAGQAQLEALHEKAQLAREAAQGSAAQLGSLEANVGRLEDVLAVRDSALFCHLNRLTCRRQHALLSLPCRWSQPCNNLQVQHNIV
jgi:hypothetical protein